MPRSAASRRAGGSRRLLLASVVFGLFVLLDFALFGWLIFNSMSEREIERVLLETRREAETLAQRIARRAEGEEDLYTVLAIEQETQAYIDAIPRQREIVRSIEIRDREGRLVFQNRSRTTVAESVGPEDPPLLESPEMLLESSVETETREHQEEYQVPDIEVAIGDLGTLTLGISPARLRQRIDVLRGDLIRQTTVVAAVTGLLMIAAYLIIWYLWQRSRRLEAAAAEAERMAYIGTLASGLAHEIRNPLNSLSLNMQMMKEEIDGGQAQGPTTGRLLSITRSEINRLERLVTDFLSYARPRSPEREEVRPRDLFERVRQVVDGMVSRRGGRVEIDDDSEGARLKVDVAQLTQLLLNLVQNGIAAAEDVGRPPRLLLTARRHGEAVALEVADNGPGIRDEDRGRIFDVFYSTRKGGTGLGLAVVERIAHNHGGTVEVESGEGGGALFRVLLPEAEDAEEAEG